MILEPRQTIPLTIKNIPLWYEAELKHGTLPNTLNIILLKSIYETDELLNSTSETNDVIYVGQLNLNKK